MQFHQLIKTKKVIFWDFDGVIKDSVPVKTKAFAKLFEKYGSDVQKEVVSYHLKHGGVSRFDKVRYFYTQLLGKTITEIELNQVCDEFSDIVLQGVIDSPWVPGVHNYLINNPYNQEFVLVTGTPQEEIELILERLQLKGIFSSIHGSPNEKKEVVKSYINNHAADKNDLLMIGDANTDYEAAILNNITFVLRKTDDNLPMHALNNIYAINDFNDIEGVSI